MSQSLGLPLLQGWQTCAVATLLGVASHLFHYIKGNREPQSISIASVHLLLVPVVPTTITALHSLTVDSLLLSATIWLSFHAGLFASMVMYRAFFHPLCRIPGPFWAKITKLPTIVIARSGKLHELHTEWARKYGPVVRIGQSSKSTAIGIMYD
jgi:hypothetical protein